MHFSVLYFCILKFLYSEKATKLCKIFALLLTVCTLVKSKVNISQNCVAFSEHMNLTNLRLLGEEGFTVVNKSFGDNNHYVIVVFFAENLSSQWYRLVG